MLKIFTCLSFLLISFTSCKKDKEQPGLTDDPPFTRSETPVYESPIGLAADASVLKSGDTLFMYYSAEDGIGLVISMDDGQTWNTPDGNTQTDFISLGRRPNDWDNTLETVEVLKVQGEYKMYFSGYREGEADNSHVENYEIGLATSTDGINFTRVTESLNQPILARDTSNANTFDRHGMTSPGIVYEGGTYYMIYAGWNVTDNWTGPNAGIRIMGATSTDGINWTKIASPLIEGKEVSYSPDINEASLLKGSDGYWYIPFSTDMSIGIARTMDFFGTWDIFPEAIVSPEYDWDSEVTAPDGFVDNGKIRLWFHGVKAPLYWPWVIGYTEADFPLDWK